MPMEAFSSTEYSVCVALAGYEGSKWDQLTTKAAEDEVLRLRGTNGWTVMHWAAEDDSRAKLAEVIAARDAGLVNATNMNGWTPLHMAAQAGHEAVAQVLLAAGADKDAKDRGGLTPLHRAAICGHKAVARVLLAAGADKNAMDKQGRTPMFLAQKDITGGWSAFLSKETDRTALVALLS